jgi:hypothetical protein
MANPLVSVDPLRAFLEDERIATLAQLKEALGTTGTMTVFRKLKTVGYRTSYSHRGKYYTLPEMPDFDTQGLWSWHSVWFSSYGNLVETVRAFVDQADSGFTASELESVLHVECKRALLKLYRDQRLARARIGGGVCLSGQTSRHPAPAKRAAAGAHRQRRHRTPSRGPVP